MGWGQSISNAFSGGGGGSGQSLGQRLGNTNQGTHWSGSGNYRGTNVTSGRQVSGSGYTLNKDGTYTNKQTGERFTLSKNKDGSPKQLTKVGAGKNAPKKTTAAPKYNYQTKNYSGNKNDPIRPAPRPATKTQANNTQNNNLKPTNAGTSSIPGAPNTKDGTPAGQSNRAPVVKAPVKAATTPPKAAVKTPAAAPAKTPAQIAADKAAADAATTAANLKARNAFTGNINHDIADAFKSKNLNPKDYQEAIDHYISDTLKGIKPTSDYSKYSYEDAGEKVLGGIRTDTIKDYQDTLNSKYGSGNYADTLFPTTRDDPILTSILQPQYTEASDAVKRAFDRGTLGQTGYDRALKDLGTQNTAGMSSLQTTGSGVMGGYKTNINNLITDAGKKAGTWDFGSGWKPNDAINSITTTGADLQGRLEGDIRGAVGGKEFFNWNDMIRKGGMAQGLYNPATDTTGGGGGSLAAAIADRTKRENTKRGLGTQGTF